MTPQANHNDEEGGDGSGGTQQQPEHSFTLYAHGLQWDCARHLRDLETAQGACTISRLRKASYAIPRIVRKLGIPRLHYAISRWHKFLDCVEHMHTTHCPSACLSHRHPISLWLNCLPRKVSISH